MLANVLSTLAVLSLALAAPVPHAKRDFNGEATFFAPGLGACGGYNGEGDMIVALNDPQWAGGSMCGKSLTINVNGISAQATVVDRCPGCAHGDLDMSPTLFTVFNPKGVGRFKMSWSFNDGSGGGQGQASNNGNGNNDNNNNNNGNGNGNNGNGNGNNDNHSADQQPSINAWAEQKEPEQKQPEQPPPEQTPTVTPTPTPTPPSTQTTTSTSTSSATTTTSTTTTSMPTSSSAGNSSSGESSASVSSKIGGSDDAVVSNSDSEDNGNLAGLNGVVTNLGRIIALGSM